MAATTSAADELPRSATRARSDAVARWTAFANEVSKGLGNAWAAKKGMAFELPLFFVAYLGILMFMGQGRIPGELVAPTLVGSMATIFFHQQVARVFWGVLSEIQTGTIEQLYLSPLRSSLLMLGRQVSAALEALVIVVLLTPPMLTVGEVIGGAGISPDLKAFVQAVVPVAALVVGTAGFSYLMAGLTVLFKRLELLMELNLVAAFILGGVLLPLNQMPGWMAVTGRLLMPIAQPVEFMRDILLGGQSLTSAPVDWGLGWLIAQPLAFLVIGAVAFKAGERIALRRGSLARY